MEVTYNPTNGELYVGDIKLRDFYIAARKRSGRTKSDIEVAIGISHPSVCNIELPNGSKKKSSNSVRVILAALEELGYTITIKEPDV